jgi:hypothetical protein
MHYQYVVTLKREYEHQVDRISAGLCLISLLSFIYEQLRGGRFNFLFGLAAFAISWGLVLNLTRKKKENQVLRFRTWLLIAGVTWIGMPFLQWISIFFFVMAVLEYQAKYPLELGFSGEGVVINQLFRKKYPWSVFNNILLKDGLLTLDFKNNKIFQREAIEENDPEAGEDEFNDYCRDQLSKTSIP